MDPISNVDQLVLLLRQRLTERGRAEAKRQESAPTRSAGTQPPNVLHALAIDEVGERQFRRALVQNILKDQFGPELLNDAKFQQVVDRVSDAIQNDPEAARLIGQVTGELRAAAR